MSTELKNKYLNVEEAAEASNAAKELTEFEEQIMRQEERRRQLDDLCMQSMEAMGAAMECVQKVMVESSLSIHQIVDLSEQAAKLGSAMASLRMSIGGIGYVGTGCGYAV